MLISSARFAKITTLKLSTPGVELLLTAAAVDPLYQEMVKDFEGGSNNVGKAVTMEDGLLFSLQDFCLEDFTQSREDMTIWSERPR